MNKPDDTTNDYILPRKDGHVQPEKGASEAADLIREKLEKLYASEPNALEEERQAEIVHPRSKHQEYMHQLNHSGKDLAQIQVEWHEYYLSLNDEEKHEVWREFYASSDATKKTSAKVVDSLSDSEKLAMVRSELAGHSQTAKQQSTRKQQDQRSVHEIQSDIQSHVKNPRKLSKKQHFQSLLFGLSVGAIVLVIFLFSFFNEIIIAPFIQPARTSAATPLIIDGDTVAPSSESQVIIPKINVQIPIQFNITSNDEATMQKELESGVAHYPTTSMPGQNGNGAYFGHSSNNIFNKGKYKFAFVLLHQLVPGDTFYITKDGKVYAYKVFNKIIVEPNAVEVLNPQDGHQAIATLITCDPPGTSLRRLVIMGDQISPDPSTNAAAPDASSAAAATTEQLTGNGQTLWGRFVSSSAGKIVLIILAIGAVLLFFRLTAPKPKRL